MALTVSFLAAVDLSLSDLLRPSYAFCTWISQTKEERPFPCLLLLCLLSHGYLSIYMLGGGIIDHGIEIHFFVPCDFRKPILDEPNRCISRSTFVFNSYMVKESTILPFSRNHNSGTSEYMIQTNDHARTVKRGRWQRSRVLNSNWNQERLSGTSRNTNHCFFLGWTKNHTIARKENE